VKFTEFLLLTGAYIAIYAVSTVTFVLLFGTPLFGAVYVFFYRGIGLLLVSGLFAAILSFMVKKLWLRCIMTYRDVLLIFTIFCCVNMVFFTHIPVTAERSISIFVLGYMANDPNKIITEQDMEKRFINQYIMDFDALGKRLHEQMDIGTVKEENGGFVITDRGKGLMRIYDFIADCFHIDKRLIHPASPSHAYTTRKKPRGNS